MIGTEKIHPDAKFVELFRDIARLKVELEAAVEKINEIHTVLSQGPGPNGRRATLHLNRGQ